MHRSLVVSIALLGLLAFAAAQEEDTSPIGGHKTGYLPIGEGKQSQMFYLYYPVEEGSATQAPLLLFIHPYSELLEAFQEFGPNEVDTDSEGKTKELRRRNRLTQKYNVLFIDNPIGVGYSKAAEGEKPADARASADHLAYALNKLFEGDLKDFKGSVYVVGFEYSAKTAIYLTKTIRDDEKSSFKIEALALVNGLIDARVQVTETGTMAFVLGLIEDRVRNAVDRLELQTISLIDQGDYGSAWKSWIKAKDLIEKSSGVSTANYRHPSRYDYDALINYIKSDGFKAKFGIKAESEFNPVDTDIENTMTEDFMKSVSPELAALLDSGLRVLLAYSQNNLDYNVAGGLQLARTLFWTGTDKFKNALGKFWRVENTDVGLTHNAENLSVVVVFDVGLNIVYDDEFVGFELIRKFVDHEL